MSEILKALVFCQLSIEAVMIIAIIIEFCLWLEATRYAVTKITLKQFFELYNINKDKWSFDHRDCVYYWINERYLRIKFSFCDWLKFKWWRRKQERKLVEEEDNRVFREVLLDWDSLLESGGSGTTSDFNPIESDSSIDDYYEVGDVVVTKSLGDGAVLDIGIVTRVVDNSKILEVCSRYQTLSGGYLPRYGNTDTSWIKTGINVSLDEWIDISRGTHDACGFYKYWRDRLSS